MLTKIYVTGCTGCCQKEYFIVLLFYCRRYLMSVICLYPQTFSSLAALEVVDRNILCRTLLLFHCKKYQMSVIYINRHMICIYDNRWLYIDIPFLSWLDKGHMKPELTRLWYHGLTLSQLIVIVDQFRCSYHMEKAGWERSAWLRCTDRWVSARKT